MVGSELIGCNSGRRRSLFLQQSSHQFQRCLRVPSGLDEKIEDLAFIVDRSPQPVTPPSNDDDHFIEMPEIARCRPHAAQILCDRRAEFEKPAPHALVGNIKAPLRKQILYISIAQSEPGIEPNRVANNIRWKSMASKRDVIHLDRLSQMPLHVLPVNVTMPITPHLGGGNLPARGLQLGDTVVLNLRRANSIPQAQQQQRDVINTNLAA